MTEDDLRRRLAAVEPPDHEAAERRAWQVVGAAADDPGSLGAASDETLAWHEKGRTGAGRAWKQRLEPGLRRPVAAAAIAAAAIAVAASPAGAAVADWVRGVFDTGPRNPAPALVELPTPGRVLATSAAGAWVIGEDGSKRRLGPYADATWSPRGLFVAATRGPELVVVEPDGDVRWALARHGRTDAPAWSPDGYRIAYRAGSELRVVAGDGSGDGRVAAVTSHARPAWRPTGGHVLAYSDPDGRIVTVATDSGRRLWRSAPGPRPETLAWTPDGRRLLVLTAARVRVLGPGGHDMAALTPPTGARLTALAIHPSGDRVALARTYPSQSRAETAIHPLPAGGGPSRRVFSGDGRFSDLAWSPNGRWLLIGWPTADQWLFVRSSATPKVVARGGISRGLDPAAALPTASKVVATSGVSHQLDPDESRRARFPRVEGWCCVRRGP